MKKTLYLSPILLATLFFVAVRYSEETGKNRMKTKEEALQKVLAAMQEEKPEALQNLCSTEAMRSLKSVLDNRDEFRKMSISKVIPQSEASSVWKVWKFWATKVKVQPSMKWEKNYRGQYYPIVPDQGVGLFFYEQRHGWELNTVIFSFDE